MYRSRSLPHITVILSTYNWPDALDLSLSALARQDYPDFDVIVADDGSGEETTELIHRYCASQCYSLRHVWQPDDGFRKARIHNQAILKADGEYVVFLDGDCITRPHWLTRHARLAQQRRFLTGNRILLSPSFTRHVIANRIPLEHYTYRDWREALRNSSVNRLRPLWYLPDGPWRHLRRRLHRYLFGCNMGVWLRDLHAVGGFDERYEGWGHEDNDLAARLINSGILRKDGRYATGVIHLWHEHVDRGRREHNRELVNAVLQSGATQAVKGLGQHRGYAGGISN